MEFFGLGCQQQGQAYMRVLIKLILYQHMIKYQQVLVGRTQAVV
jgi:hypothetical protein